MTRSDNKRRSFRTAATGCPEPVLLRILSTEVPVTVLDESADGLGVLVDHPSELWLDQVGMLKTRLVWYEVRVTYILRHEPQDDRAENQPPKFRIGLKRLREIIKPDRAGIGSLPRRVMCRLFPRESAATLSGLSLIVMCFATAMLSLVLMSRGWRNAGPWVRHWRWAPRVVDRRAIIRDAADRQALLPGPGRQPMRWEQLAQ